jgi:hypothetical protein
VDSAGAVYVFARSAGTWSPAAYVKASNPGASDAFGTSVALSGDGATLAVGASGEDSAAGINGDQTDNSAPDAGAVYVFTQAGGTWSPQAYVKATSPAKDDGLGNSIALSADGSTLAAGAPGVASFAGAAYVFTRSAATWSQDARLVASNASPKDDLGESISLSADGSTVAVGAPSESSAATGVGGDPGTGRAERAGAVYVFARAAAAWSQQSYVKAFNTGADDFFGSSVGLTSDGKALAVGAPFESSAATGVGGNQADDNADFAGAAYVFQ